MSSKRLLHKTVFAVLLLFTSGSISFRSQAQTTIADNSDYQTLQRLSLDFFKACQELNMETLRALSSSGDIENVPISKERLELWRSRSLINLNSPKFSRFNLSGNDASLRITVIKEYRAWKTNQPVTEPDSFNFSFVRVAGQWKVSRFEQAGHDIVAAILAATSTEEEKKIFEREREILDSPEYVSVFDYISSLDQNGVKPALDRFLNVLFRNSKNQEGVAYALFWLGYRANVRGEYREAEYQLKKAIKVAEEVHYSWLLAYAYTTLARTYVNLDDESHAQKFQQEGLRIYLTEPKDFEEALSDQRTFANTYFNNGAYENSRINYEKGLALATEAQDKQWQAVFLKDLGDTYYQQKNLPPALDSYQRSLDLFVSLPNSPLKIKNELALWEIHQSIGQAFELEKNASQALASFKKARESAVLMRDSAGITSSFGATGKYYLSIKDTKTAFSYYTEMIERLDEIKVLGACEDCLMDAVARLIEGGADFNQLESFLTYTLDKYESRLPPQEAVVLRAIRGEIYSKRGENSKAEADFNYLLHQSNIAVLWRAAILVDLATVYAAQGQFDKAWNYITQAEALESQLDDKDVLSFIKITKALLMAAFLDGGSQPVQLLQQLVANSTDKEFLSVAHVFLGIVYLANDDNEQALAHARKSLEYLDSLDSNDEFHASLRSIAMMTMSLIYSQSDQHQAALQAAQQAREIAKRLGLYSVLGRAKALEGISYYKLHQLPQARAALAEAIEVIEEQRGNQAGGLEGAISYFESAITPYMTMLDVLYEMNDYAAAVNFIERSKARVLLDVLSKDSGQNISTSSKPAKDNQDNSFGVTVPKDPSGMTSLLSQAEMKSLLPNSSIAILQYAVTEDHVYLFVFTGTSAEQGTNPSPSPQDWRERAGWKAYKLDISREELEEEIDQLRELLSDNRSGYSPHCQRLYQSLLKPAALDLVGKTSLIIIPDSILWGVPFQALQPADDHFLLEDFVITYAPSMSTLYQMSHSHHPQQPATKAGTTPDILALADPSKTTQEIEISPLIANEMIFTIGGQDAQSRPMGFNRVPLRYYVTLKPLPGAADEVTRLTTIYSPKALNVLSGAALTKENFKRIANKYRIIHLATHGILNYQVPLDSAVLIEQPAPVTRNQSDNKTPPGSVLIVGKDASTSSELLSAKWLLSAREIMQMHLRAELVVLSACDTAGGGISEGEGMIGLTWAFAAAGVPTIVASQWAVPDKTTADLMENFHRRLSKFKGTNGAENGTALALAEAARDLARNKQYRHPYYWAAFVVIGDGR